MNVDSTQENRFAVEQDVRALGFNRAKPDVVCYLVCLAGNLNLVKLRCLRRPKRQACFKGNVGVSARIGLELPGDSCFGNSDSDALLQLRSIQLDPAFD